MPMFLVNFMGSMLAIATSADNRGIKSDEMHGSEPDWHGRGAIRESSQTDPYRDRIPYLSSLALYLPSSSNVTM